MEDKKILILRGEYDYFLKYIEYDNFKRIYKSYNSKFYGIVKRVVYKFKLPFYVFFFEKWKKDIEQYDKVIIFDTLYNSLISKYIRKKNKKCEINMYFWNNISEENKWILEDKNINKFWSFDIKDAIKYKMSYNPQFYTKNIKLKKNEIIYDTVFLGRPKNRKKEIINLKKILESNKVKNNNIILIENEKDYVSYDEYLLMLSKTKSIIDIVNEGQVGLTLRCMEALFFGKKLITNNKLIKQYDFYNNQNIFIIGDKNIDTIKDFLDKPYKKIKEETIDYYDFNNWLTRF